MPRIALAIPIVQRHNSDWTWVQSSVSSQSASGNLNIADIMRAVPQKVKILSDVFGLLLGKSKPCTRAHAQSLPHTKTQSFHQHHYYYYGTAVVAAAMTWRILRFADKRHALNARSCFVRLLAGRGADVR